MILSWAFAKPEILKMKTVLSVLKTLDRLILKLLDKEFAEFIQNRKFAFLLNLIPTFIYRKSP